MTKKDISAGVVHELPADLRKALISDKTALALWEDITPLARNEWICWVISAKKDETRSGRIHASLDKMHKGMRRPCCWAGCPHR
ncbi:MAG: YdeI/OmpD-associated family protein [Candidatus Vogelbacteria bacterium]|nr:YdeI/OmpD-associated family protein [Candidatus Vogelbacteria bacterium]